ncbi:hypothetical protein [Bacillus sp. ISL-37]|uniref:hypothetical protein n=1 Tax=Bacillus sp. ISL-37 TaxID=2819123 RepID=UPI001BE750BD|nr:hypothetical protein [Bacillus sp. ISL-37]
MSNKQGLMDISQAECGQYVQETVIDHSLNKNAIDKCFLPKNIGIRNVVDRSRLYGEELHTGIYSWGC